MGKNINWNKFRDDAAVKIMAALLLDDYTMRNIRNNVIYKDDALINKAIHYANNLVTKLKDNPYSND